MTFEIDILKTDDDWGNFINQLKWYNKSLSYGDRSRHEKLALVHYINYLNTDPRELPDSQELGSEGVNRGADIRRELIIFDPKDSGRFTNKLKEKIEILLDKNYNKAIEIPKKTIQNDIGEMIKKRNAAKSMVQELKNDLKYCLLLILNYINRIFEGFHINKSLFELQNKLQSKDIESPLIIPGNEKQNLALLDLFCHKYFISSESGIDSYYSPFIKKIAKKLSEKTVIGILVLDIAEGETEKILAKEDYEAIISNSILDKFKYAYTLSPMTVGIIPLIKAMETIGQHSKYKKPNEESSLTQKLHTMSAIEFMNSFYTGYKTPYFVGDDKLCDLKTLKSNAKVNANWADAGEITCHSQGGGSNKIINQNIRVKELNKLKKLYKALNKK